MQEMSCRDYVWNLMLPRKAKGSDMNYEHWKERLLDGTIRDLQYCEKMGYESVQNGANLDNCNHRIFGSIEGKKAWERGKKRAELEAQNNANEAAEKAKGSDGTWKEM